MSASASDTLFLHHGGQLRSAATRYGIPLSEWIDLSTGINPSGWPIPPLADTLWSRLPEDNDGLTEAAQHYYKAPALLPVAGSQAAIQALPQLRSNSRVSFLSPGYAEHTLAWQRAGHTVTPIAATDLDHAALHADVLIIVNPNNPTGESFDTAQLLQWHAKLAARGGWLIVDEAFMDAFFPATRLASYSDRPGLIVLHSLGKFFGLAGARVGFVIAHPALLRPLATLLGPWAINGPARWIATQALQDRHWHHATRQRLLQESRRLHHLLTAHGLAPAGSTPLFQWVCTMHAPLIHEKLAQRGILTRLFNSPSSLRFGLPGQETAWKTLENTLSTFNLTELE